jgi:hypothetical protein
VGSGAIGGLMRLMLLIVGARRVREQQGLGGSRIGSRLMLLTGGRV